nr:gliding motility-associated C-terminal domain-containing protein [Bacteroidota bacterium]
EQDMFATTCDGVGEDIVSYFTSLTGLSTEWTFNGTPVADPSSAMDEGIYTLVATNVAGCSDTAYVDLSIAANPLLGPDQTVTVCDGMVMDLADLYATGTMSTAWTINGVAVADPTSVTEEGEYILIATNTDGCSATASVTIEVLAAPALGSDQVSSICEGASIDLASLYNVSGLISTWSLGGVVVADPSNVNNTGNYRLIATNSAGCADTAFAQVNVNTGPALGPDQTFTLCSWQTVDLVAAFSVGSMDVTFTHNDQPITLADSIYTEGIYIITAVDGAGCSDTAMANVINIECMCVADFTDDARCMQEPVQFTLLADSMILGAEWSFNGAAANSSQIDPIIRFDTEGGVSVMLRATLGCGVVELERTIRIQDCSDSCSVWIPSSFTPNDDGINDSWTWNGECDPDDFSMSIYDRFGELIFTSNDPLMTWDGKYNGTISPLGVYAYRVGYRLPYQERTEVMGAITLVR